MGRAPKPVAPREEGRPGRPTPAAADYSDEVTDADLKALEKVIKEREGAEGDEWELVDGPGW